MSAQESFPPIPESPKDTLAHSVEILTSRQSTLKLRTSTVLVLLVVAMSLLKLYCAYTTIGTNDVLFFGLFGRLTAQDGICALYHQTRLMNHTPFVAGYCAFLQAVVGQSVRSFAFWLRVPGIISDLIVAAFLISQRGKSIMVACPDWALAVFICSPVSFMISGFHGNFDSLTVMFLFFAAWFCARGQYLRSALLYALSLQIKVAGLVLLPVFLIFWWRHKTLYRCAPVVLVVCIAGWIEPLLEDPRIFIHNVLSYNGYWGLWGVTYLLERTGISTFAFEGFGSPNTVKLIVIEVLKFAVLTSIGLLAWSQRRFSGTKFFPIIAVAWSIFFMFTPGGSVQYMTWIAPFVLLVHTRWYVILTFTSTLFCFFFYRSISGPMPWDYGNSMHPRIPFWSPWMLMAWLGASYGLYIYFCRRSELFPVGKEALFDRPPAE